MCFSPALWFSSWSDFDSADWRRLLFEIASGKPGDVGSKKNTQF